MNHAHQEVRDAAILVVVDVSEKAGIRSVYDLTNDSSIFKTVKTQILDIIEEKLSGLKNFKSKPTTAVKSHITSPVLNRKKVVQSPPKNATTLKSKPAASQDSPRVQKASKEYHFVAYI